MKTNIIALFLMALTFSGTVSAKEMAINKLIINLCESNTSQNYFYTEYSNAVGRNTNAYVPLKSIVISVDSNGQVLAKASNNQIANLGLPTRSWVNGSCKGFEFAIPSSSFKMIFNHDDSARSYPCIDSGAVLPVPALCAKQKAQVIINPGPAQISSSCTEVIQVTTGSGHLNNRIGGDCIGR